MTLDAYAGTRNLIENAFSYLTWHEDACEAAGFKGISQVWKDEPAWYFWLNNTQGGFLLRLHAEESVKDSQYVSLSVHYYPPVEDNGSDCQLSTEEQRLLADDSVFDRPTQTPRYEEFETCLPHFITAEIGLMFGQENQLQLLVYSSKYGEPHPSANFLDLLVSTLNFEAKSHHRKALQLEDGQAASLFLIYDEVTFKDFLDHFELDESLLDEQQTHTLVAKWQHFAHMNVDCSMDGACSCH